MKFGYRRPSPRSSFSARTTARVKRSVKRSVNPLYGKRGMGYINNPKKAVYNKVYNKTTTSVFSNSVMSNLSTLTVVELKEILRSNNLKVSGRKQELIDRIIENVPTYSDVKTQDNSYITKDDELDTQFEQYINETDKSPVGCVMFLAIVYISPLIIGAIILFALKLYSVAFIISIMTVAGLLMIYSLIK